MEIPYGLWYINIEETDIGGVENGWEKQHKTGYHTKDILAG